MNKHFLSFNAYIPPQTYITTGCKIKRYIKFIAVPSKTNNWHFFAIVLLFYVLDRIPHLGNANNGQNTWFVW